MDHTIGLYSTNPAKIGWAFCAFNLIASVEFFNNVLTSWTSASSSVYSPITKKQTLVLVTTFSLMPGRFTYIADLFFTSTASHLCYTVFLLNYIFAVWNRTKFAVFENKFSFFDLLIETSDNIFFTFR